MIQVYLNDTEISYDDTEQHFFDANIWAKKYCPSYRGYDVQDVSDFSYTNDRIALYRFGEEKDALIFQLKWK